MDKTSAMIKHVLV